MVKNLGHAVKRYSKHYIISILPNPSIPDNWEHQPGDVLAGLEIKGAFWLSGTYMYLCIYLSV